MTWLKVRWHCFWHILDFEHSFRVHYYQYPDRAYYFCICGYKRPDGETNQDTSGM